MKCNVTVKIKHTQDHPAFLLKKEYATWEEADKAYEHWLALYNLSNSGVEGVELVEVAERRKAVGT